ncbi:WXG100 family type VII secretion target [Actinoalloteichus hymeniacidonis]|uniref:ESAT-6-like protein n=1 Tax=Actinoalloteichus hymeniacidonis TaxID=340345 RepID=A0AAC9HUD9_9PSEU|nr:WXG100 family type VII secretion target [Actinoalloteichus hymeniacidonis]AOS65764.1 WXG100 family type VII secretion target [Actinoalloteichus hymeniacidonis]MBB5906146.1 WXG100 family type VII secretion target [Actinoalloteichus hymeniacidonis]
MGGAIKVSFSTIVNASEEVNNAGNQAEEIQSNLKTRLAPIVSSWEGQAQENWQQVQAKWDEGAQQLRETIAAIGSALGVAAENYQAGEQANAARFS